MALTPNNKDNVGVGKADVTGLVKVAPTSVAQPTDATTALATEFQNAGYISEDGMTNSISIDSETIKDMNGDEVVTVRASRSEEFIFTGIEENPVMLGLYHGDDNVGATAGGLKVVHNSDELPYKTFVFEIALSPKKKKRIVVPQGKVTKLGDIVYKRNQAVGLPITIAALKDSEGKTAYEYIVEVVS